MASQVGLDLSTLVGMISVHPSVKIGESRDGGIGRRVGLRIQCPKGVQVQILFPAPDLINDLALLALGTA